MNFLDRCLKSVFVNKFFYSSAFVFLSSSQLMSAPSFSGYYSENSDALPGLSFAYMTPDYNGGFSLMGYASEENLGETTTYSPVLARFNESGEELWAVFINGTGDLSHYALTPDFDDSGKFFAGLVEDGPRAVLSINNGSDLSSDFAYEIDLEVEPSQATISSFRDSTSGLIQDKGSSIEVLLLDSSGQKIFDKSYSSPDFLSEDVVGGSGENSAVQSVYLQQFEDKSGYLLSVTIMENDYSDPLNPSGVSTNIAIRLGNDGAVQWSSKFELAVSLATPSFPMIGPNNSVFYTLNETKTVIDLVNAGFSTEQKTHFIKFNSSGNLEFSKTFDGVLLGSNLTSVNESSVYLSGGQLSEGETFGYRTSVFLKVNSSTGAIEAEGGFDDIAIGMSNFSGRISTGLVGTFISEEVVGSGNYVTTLFKLDENLESVLAVDYSEGNAFNQAVPTSDDDIIFSSNFIDTPEVGVFALNSDLGLIADGCDLFTTKSLSIVDPNIVSENLQLSSSVSSITVSDNITPLDSVTIPLERLELTLTACGDFVPGEGGSSGGGGDGETGDSVKLINISTRGKVGTDANVMIGGFVIGTGSDKKILVQAVADELAGVPIDSKLPNPQLIIVPVASAGDTSTHLANDDWSGVGTEFTSAIQAAGSSVGATTLEVGSTSAAMVAEFAPGAYTVIVAGVGGGEGVALIEVYEVE